MVSRRVARFDDGNVSFRFDDGNVSFVRLVICASGIGRLIFGCWTAVRLLRDFGCLCKDPFASADALNRVVSHLMARVNRNLSSAHNR